MGDGIRRIARALYERADDEEKKEVKDMVKRLFLKGEETISLGRMVRSGLSSENLARQLDSNRDGRLDVKDILVLFYYNKRAIMILLCSGCRERIFGRSFTCFKCLFNTPDLRYALCPDCYGGGKFKHRHPLSASSTSATTSQDQALLLKLSDLLHKHPKPVDKKNMQRLWETAKSVNGGASGEMEAMAENYFKSMEDNQHLNLKKFSTLMIQQESAVDAFLKPRPDSDFATNYMKNQMRMVLQQSSSIRRTPAISAAASVATTSTPQTHYHVVNRPSSSLQSTPNRHVVNRPSSSLQLTSHHHVDNRPNSSNQLAPILKVASATFKIVDMALTFASLSGMCTIL